MKNPKSIAVIGASGYTGMELIRLLQFCPQYKLDAIVGDRTAGKSYASVHPSFYGVVDMEVLGSEAISSLETDAVVLALPHGKSVDAVKQLMDAGYKGKIVDMGSDFRLKTADDYQKWYKYDHKHPGLLSAAVYGLADFNQSTISGADLVANPGCFASAIQSGILPLLKSGIRGPFHITGLTGASGSGVDPSPSTHFPSRDGNLKAYKVLDHQHLGEVFRQIGESGFDQPDIRFIPVSAPITRGIWITISLTIRDLDLDQVFRDAYAGRSLVRLRSGLPNLKDVVGTAFTDIGWIRQGDAAVVGVAIDNLGKGAAGQAIQNLNLMFGFSDDMGLKFAGNII